ncbi:hypothetical protein EON63_21805, partial [archaeon]
MDKKEDLIDWLNQERVRKHNPTGMAAPIQNTTSIIRGHLVFQQSKNYRRPSQLQALPSSTLAHLPSATASHPIISRWNVASLDVVLYPFPSRWMYLYGLRSSGQGAV